MGKWQDLATNQQQQGSGKWSAMVQPEPAPTQTEPTGDDLGWGEALASAFMNIPESTVKFASDMYQAVRHPIKTGRAMGQVFAGGVQKLTPGEQPEEPYFDALVDFMKSRYGSIDDFKKTISEDPVGVVADIATVMIPAGGAVKGAGAAAKAAKLTGTGRALTAAGGAISKAGAAAEPIGAAVRGASKLIPKKAPRNMYLSSAKFGTTIPREDRLKMAQLALDESIMPTVKGLDKLRDKIDNLNTEIAAKIDAAVDSGERIPVDKLFKHFDELKEKYSLSGKPMTNLRAIDRVKKEIKKAQELYGRDELTPKQAQKIKQQIYRDLESHYSSVKESPAAAQAQKAVARAAKESIEEIIPEIKELNRTDGALIQLRHSIERSAARIANRDLIGIGTPIKATMGGVAGGYGGAIGGTVLGILDTPQVKARLSIVLNKLKKKGVLADPKAAMARLGTFQAGRTERATEEVDVPIP